MIIVNHRGAARLRGGHLWVYRSDVVTPAEAPAGALVHVRDQRGRSLGSALYSSASQIAIRLLSNQEIAEEQLPSLLRERIASAVQFRRRVAHDTDSYRVIFSEADLLPGLIVDKYNDVLSMQALTQAFARDDLWQIVVEALSEHFPDCSVVERVDPHIRELEQLPERPVTTGARRPLQHCVYDEWGALSLRWSRRTEDRRRSSISVRTTLLPPASAMARRSIASPIREGSRCIWRAFARV